MLIMKAFKGWLTGSAITLSTVEINELLPKKYYVIAIKILMLFVVSGRRKLSIRLNLFHVHFFFGHWLLKAKRLVARKIKEPR